MRLATRSAAALTGVVALLPLALGTALAEAEGTGRMGAPAGWTTCSSSCWRTTPSRR